jgi:hypothetical protein
VWERFVGGEPSSYQDPSAGRWMEAASLESGEMLVYPNNARLAPEVVVYTPQRIGTARLMLSRLALSADGEARVDNGPCTELIDGELNERQVVCVETGCDGECGRTSIRKDGIEILECVC